MKIEIVSPCNGVLKEIFLGTQDIIIPDQSFGIIINDNNQYQTISSEVEGQINKIYVDKGQQIVRGMILAEIKVR